ncbi:delta-like protein C [Belonocnema kinseyi]|uniref:delta-like protein C n=1 Tax=Belonocnema kinseyi TaxID=2817044 RepID=UPI00143CCEF0|nr:delta-like protein C [Belonocnema kinseyi]
MIPLLVNLFLLIGAREIAPVDNGASVGLAAVLGLSLLPIGFAAGPRYVPKWKKQACEIPATQHPNSHYVCDEAGEVKCIQGWTGDLCDVPICRKGCDPIQGYCRRPGECRCKLGFYGETCDKCVALPGCQHGRCNGSFGCDCDPGWRNLFCSEPICASDCNPSQGYCDKPGECKCRLGWQGHKCKQCAVLPGCVHGTCQGPLECRCNPGWTGLLCQTPVCAQGCSREHGGCWRPGTCRCRVGWTGPNCTECVPYPGCVHGTCKRPWECRCQPGWTGDLCEEKLTYCEEHSDLCKNNGTCISMTKEDGNYRCFCPLGFTGRQCQIEMATPDMELKPPKPEVDTANPATSVPISEIKPEIQEEVHELEEKPQAETGPEKEKEKENEEEKKKDETIDNNKETSAEPLRPIVITDPPEIDPAATAGKWPPEPSTESSSTERDAENET